MKTICSLLLISLVLSLVTSCSQMQNPNLVAALTPATSLTVAKKPKLAAPLAEVVAVLRSVSGTGEVTPATLLANLNKFQQKNPELVSIIQLVGAAYNISYKPGASNDASLIAIADAIDAGLPKPEDPASK